MIRVLLADDHQLIRVVLQAYLQKEEDLELVAEASTGHGAVELARSCDVDVVLLDANMPGRGGLETLETLKALRPSPKVLMVTAHLEDDYAVRCIKSGADGYFTKDRAGDDLVEAIRCVAQGKKWVSPGLAERILQSFDSTEPSSRHVDLTNRELEILCLLGEGLTISEISSRIHLSVKTVGAYRRKILRKTGLRNDSEIIRYVLEQGLVA